MVQLDPFSYSPDLVATQQPGQSVSLTVDLLTQGGKHRCVLVENEERSLSRLRRLLQDFDSEVQIVGEAMDGPHAVETIGALQPDLVFMDIDLPGFSGLEVLQTLHYQPMVIFTTAFNQHALEAFRCHAVDYLMKPLDSESIQRALMKLRAMGLHRDQLSRALAQAMTRVASNYLSRISCKVGDRTILVKTGEVLYFQADNKYTSVHTVGRDLLIDTPLIELERRLDPADFVRIHRATLVNIAWISEIRRGYDGKVRVVLKDTVATELVASRTYADGLRRL